jgi:hypothetical protein
MRVEVLGNSYEVSDVLRIYTESRVWLAVRRAADQLSWVGVRIMGEDGHALRGRVVCQVDVWLRGIGLVTVRHVDVNPYVGIDCAAVRLEQAVVRKLREAGRNTASPRDRTITKRPDAPAPTRYAVVVMPADAAPQLSLSPWLKRRYGFEQLQTISLARSEWSALVTGDVESPQLQRLRDRLALAQLGRPEAIIALAAASQPSSDEGPDARTDVEQAAATLRSLGLPIAVIGVWVNEHWDTEECLIESEELSGETASSRASDPKAGELQRVQ